MADAKFAQEGRIVYETFCNALKADGWNFTAHDEDMAITCGARGDDLPMELLVRIDCDRALITILSIIPTTFDEDKRVEGNLAVCVANQGMVHGCFDYDNTKGKIYFRLSNSFMGCKIGAELCTYMIYCACSTVDNYNDKFLMMSKGMMTLEQFIKSENG